MILQFFAKIIAEGAIIEQKIARAARKLPEDEGEQPKTQVISCKKEKNVVLFFIES